MGRIGFSRKWKFEYIHCKKQYIYMISRLQKFDPPDIHIFCILQDFLYLPLKEADEHVKVRMEKQ